MRVYAVGLDNDKTLARFATQADVLGCEVVLVNLHLVARGQWRVAVPAGAGETVVGCRESSLVLDPQGRYFARLVDLSPVLSEPDSGAWRNMLVALAAFLETVQGPVVNRPGAHVHNGAKPYHEHWLAQRGFLVPPAITTSDPEAIREFLGAHKTGIVKASSGTRGSAQAVTAKSFAEFESGQGPVHVQEYIAGYDVRVHLVGRDLHAEKIACATVDYRARGAVTEHMPTEVPAELADAMVWAANDMGLAFTGWDFKVDAEGRYWCLEVNPMPGYDVYDRRAGGAISSSLVRYLCDGEHH